MKYSEDVKQFCIQERHFGCRWRDIREDAQSQYGVCPSQREIYRWYLSLDIKAPNLLSARFIGLMDELLDVVEEVFPSYFYPILHIIPYLRLPQFDELIHFLKRGKKEKFSHIVDEILVDLYQKGLLFKRPRTMSEAYELIKKERGWQ